VLFELAAQGSRRSDGQANCRREKQVAPRFANRDHPNGEEWKWKNGTDSRTPNERIAV
jgi:hypothetical protein